MEDLDDAMLDPVKSIYDDRNAEAEIEKSMSRKYLLGIFKDNNLDIEKISAKKLGNEQFHKFNIVVKDLVEMKLFDMKDIVCFLEENYFDNMRASIKCFNEENYLILKQELLASSNINKMIARKRKKLKAQMIRNREEEN